ALHHARTALAAEGRRVEVTLLPDPADPAWLARLRLAETVPVTADAVRLVQTIRVRHTDRRPVTGTPLGPAELEAVLRAVDAEGARLHILRPDQVLDLASAVSRAQQAEAADEAWQAELAYWTGGTRPEGAGIPDTAIPAQPPQTTVPGRDFGHPGTLSVSAGHDRGATFAILYGAQDSRENWVRAGQALPAVWLTATDHGISALPLSATVEAPATDPHGWAHRLARGAAAFNARLAFAVAGHPTQVRLRPDPDDPQLLARLTPGEPHPPSPAEKELYAAIPLRHSNRQPFNAEP